MGRALRLRKVRDALHLLDMYINTEYFSILKTIVINLLAVIFLSHFIACLWYSISDTGNIQGDRSWIVEFHVQERSLFFQYLTSLHWALSQFTPGSMKVEPQSARERLFAVLILVVGIIIFASIVSSIT